jgi:hypothetical protein
MKCLAGTGIARDVGYAIEQVNALPASYPTCCYSYSSLSLVLKIDVLVIGGTPAASQSNPYFLKVFDNHQNTPPSHLNEVDSTLYFILGDWILIVCLSNHITKNIKVVIGNEALVQNSHRFLLLVPAGIGPGTNESIILGSNSWRPVGRGRGL